MVGSAMAIDLSVGMAQPSEDVPDEIDQRRTADRRARQVVDCCAPLSKASLRGYSKEVSMNYDGFPELIKARRDAPAGLSPTPFRTTVWTES